MEKEELEREKTKRLSIKEGAAAAASEGFGTRYITPYALALGATNAHIGFLNAFPSLLGNFSKLFTPKAMEKISRKKISFYCALIQALMWIPLLAIGIAFFVFNIDLPIILTLLIFVYTLLVVFGSFYGPVWTSWMKDIVTEKKGQYFGMRNRVTTLVALISMLLASFILDYFRKTKIFFGFVVLFAIAFIARSISAFLFLKKYEPEFQCEKECYFSFWQFLRYMPRSNFGKFVLLVSLIQLATALASPFFAVYMLKELNFSYTQWITVTIASSIASLLVVPMWGRFIDVYGSVTTLKICSFAIPIIPLLWLLTPLFSSLTFLLVFLVTIQLFSGSVWAGFNLSSSTFIYDTVTRQRTALCTAYFNVLEGIGVFIGATLGGIIASTKWSILGSSLLLLFLLSGITRFAIALGLTHKIKEVREVKNFGIKEAKEKLRSLTLNKLLNYLELKT